MNNQFGSKIINPRVAYRDVGEGREQERKLCETQAIAGLLLAFRALVLIILNPNLIRPDLCRGPLIDARTPRPNMKPVSSALPNAWLRPPQMRAWSHQV